jgi:hypothetical protein
MVPKKWRKQITGACVPFPAAPATLDDDLVQARPGGCVLDHLPGRGERLRCAACGNLTRFDVVASRRTAAFWHYSVAGALTIEEERQLAVTAEEVRCRWCGSAGDVQVVPAIGEPTSAER